MKVVTSHMTDRAGNDVLLATVRAGESVLAGVRPYLITETDYRESPHKVPMLLLTLADARGRRDAWPCRYIVADYMDAETAQARWPSEYLDRANEVTARTTHTVNALLKRYTDAFQLRGRMADHLIILDEWAGCADDKDDDGDADSGNSGPHPDTAGVLARTALSLVRRMAQGYDWTPEEVDAFEAACRDAGITEG